MTKTKIELRDVLTGKGMGVGIEEPDRYRQLGIGVENE